VQASTPTATPAPTFTPTPSGPPPASAPPDRIVIPAIELDAPVVPVGWKETDEGVIWDVANYAAGWHKTSAYPGHVGNTVLSGHHNIKGEVFRYLIDLEPGDEVFLYVGEMVYHYVVTEKHLLEEKGMSEEVRRSNAQWIAPTDDERLTLVTCWPYTSNTHRLIIVAKPFWKLEIGG
jgi:sortase A